MNVSFLQELLNTVAEQGRSLLPKSLFGSDPEEGMQTLVSALMSGRGEASGVAVARQLLMHFELLDTDTRCAFFRYLAATLKPDQKAVDAAAKAYLKTHDQDDLLRLRAVIESPMQEFFRRLNRAPGATAQIVAMRKDLLNMERKDEQLRLVDADLRHLLTSWFNRGFLVLKRIDWQTSAAILERIIAYEAVHRIDGWDDLRRRLDPVDRRCYGFFHPSLVDDPVIFVQVALTKETPDAIAPVLNEKSKQGPAPDPTTAVFYSISNCQEGLKSISFGNFLIKQVVEELTRDLPSLKNFATLSPVPGFAHWLQEIAEDPADNILTGADKDALKTLSQPGWHQHAAEEVDLKSSIVSLAATYFLTAKTVSGKPVDPVARFHLGNGARLDRINWLGDISTKGLTQAHGLMVNYRYDLREIEKNHEAFANRGHIAASRSVRLLARKPAPKTDSTKQHSIQEHENKPTGQARAAQPRIAAPPAAKATKASKRGGKTEAPRSPKPGDTNKDKSA